MKIRDLIWDSLQSLWVRKLRTALNLVGIVISCVLLLSTLSAASGIRNSIQRFLDGSYEALQFRIVPDYDRSIEPPADAIAVDALMSQERRERVTEMLTQQWRRRNLVRPRTFTDEQMERLRQIESVVDVAPRLTLNCRVLEFLDPLENAAEEPKSLAKESGPNSIVDLESDSPSSDSTTSTDDSQPTPDDSSADSSLVDQTQKQKASDKNSANTEGGDDAGESENEFAGNELVGSGASDSPRGPVHTAQFTPVNTNLTASSYYDQELATRVIFGEFLSQDEPDGLLVHEELAYRIGIRSDEEVASLVGKTIRVEMRHGADQHQIFVNQFMQQSPGQRSKLLESLDAIITGQDISKLDAEALAAASEFAKTRRESGAAGLRGSSAKPIPTRDFKIVGIFRSRSKEEAPSFLVGFLGEGQLVAHYSPVESLARELGQRQTGSARVFIDSVRNLEKVTELATQENVATISATKTVQRMHEALDDSKQTVFAVVGIILLVSAVGISNTMIISLVERSEEIGIMKAIGASNRTITRMVIFEGAVTGLLGGLVAIGITYVIAYFGNELMRDYIQEKVRFDVEGEMFCIEPWMLVASIVIAVVVSTLASLWPARRAARLDPINAMRGST